MFVHPRRSPESLSRSIIEVTSNSDCWLLALKFLPQQFGAVCGNYSSQLSMRLRSCLLSRPSTSSPLDNRAHPMTDTNQAPYLEGLYREMHVIAEQIRMLNEINARILQHLATNNSPTATTHIIKEVDRSRHSHRSSDQDSQKYHQ